MDALILDALIGGAALLPPVVVALVLVFGIFWQIHRVVELIHNAATKGLDAISNLTFRIKVVPADDDELNPLYDAIREALDEDETDS